MFFKITMRVDNTLFGLCYRKGEWIIKVVVNGDPVPERYYFTDDKQDAIGTLRTMAEEEYKRRLIAKKLISDE